MREILGHSEFMAMWQSDLATWIFKAFFAPSWRDDIQRDIEYPLAVKVWQERFGHMPTIGEITTLSK